MTFGLTESVTKRKMGAKHKAFQRTSLNEDLNKRLHSAAELDYNIQNLCLLLEDGTSSMMIGLKLAQAG